MTDEEPKPRKKRGRPPMGGETMTEAVRVRMTVAERLALEADAEAEGVDVAELCRQRLFGR